MRQSAVRHVPEGAHKAGWDEESRNGGRLEVERGTGGSLDVAIDKAGTSTSLIGREPEMEQLRHALAESRESGRMVALVGEAGMGKTSLAEALSEEARAGEWNVVWARCWEAVDTPPYWPWVQVLRQVLSSSSEARDTLTPWRAAALGQIAPEISGQASETEPSPGDRFALFDAMSFVLRAGSRQQPLLIVLEDLHAADEPSLLLLQFLAKEQPQTHSLLLCSYDERLARRRPAHARLLTQIGHDARRVVLSGFAEDAIKELYEREAGETLSGPMAAAIARVSEGNPFFVDEAIRLLTAKGGLHRPDYSVGFRVPEGARDIVRSRLQRLPDETNEILSVASVIGRAFDVSLLAQLSELDVDTVLELLEKAVEEDVVEEASALGRYSFTHILIRETLYEDLTAARRMRLHRRVAEILESVYSGDLDPHLSELAHHWFKAAQAGDLTKTVEYAARAAESAAAQQAYEEAARLYQRALKAGESIVLPRDQRESLKKALEDVQRHAGEPPAAVSVAHAETHTFRREGDYWTITFQDTTSRLKDSKGLRYIAHLLANPAREVHVIDLVQASEGGAPAPRRQSSTAAAEGLDSDAFGDAGEVLDAKAKAQYKQRIDELREEIEEAEEFNDPERAARAQEELDALVQQLAGAVGLGGRDRKSASQAERARVNVTKTVKDALKKIEEADPELGHHLQSTVRTGTFCSYTPDPRVPIVWHL